MSTLTYLSFFEVHLGVCLRDTRRCTSSCSVSRNLRSAVMTLSWDSQAAKTWNTVWKNIQKRLSITRVVGWYYSSQDSSYAHIPSRDTLMARFRIGQSELCWSYMWYAPIFCCQFRPTHKSRVRKISVLACRHIYKAGICVQVAAVVYRYGTSSTDGGQQSMRVVPLATLSTPHSAQDKPPAALIRPLLQTYDGGDHL